MPDQDLPSTPEAHGDNEPSDLMKEYLAWAAPAPRPKQTQKKEPSALEKEFAAWMNPPTETKADPIAERQADPAWAAPAPQPDQGQNKEPSALEQEFATWMNPSADAQTDRNAELQARFNRFREILAQLNASRASSSGTQPADSADDADMEIQKLHRMLTEAGIPHKILPRFLAGGYQIVYYGHKDQPAPEPGVIRGPGVGAVCSVIEGPGTYGYEDDRLEISGLLTDEECESNSVAGDLTAEDVFQRIQTHWLSEET